MNLSPGLLGDFSLIIRFAGTGLLLWLVPWWLPAANLFPTISGAGRVSLAFLIGVCSNVISSYFLGITGLYSPLVGVLVQLVLGLGWTMLTWQRYGSKHISFSGSSWILLISMAFFLIIRLPDPLTHGALGGNDPWGHLVLSKALAHGDMITGFHPFSFYPRGYHFLVLTLAQVSGGSLYEVMRLSAPVLSLFGLVGAYALASRSSSAFGGMIAAFVYAVPPYRHLVLAAHQTTLEPDRFSFILLPGLLLLLLRVMKTGSSRAAVSLFIGGLVLILTHPLSVQFLVGWIILGGFAALLMGKEKRVLLATVCPALILVLAAWAYFRTMNTTFGITVMSHLAPQTSFDIGGYGIDLQRVLFGTGLKIEPMDLVGLAAVVLLMASGLTRRNVSALLLSFVLLHSLYSAVTDALYIGDYGHAPPYYAMAFAWAAGVLLGDSRFARFRFALPFLLLAGVLYSSPFSGPGSSWLKVMLLSGLVLTIVLVLIRRRLVTYVVPISVGIALFVLRPVPVSYAHLGYPQAAEWALRLQNCPQADVYSQGLISKLPDGTPFPTLDPVRAIVWPKHRPKALTALLMLAPDHEWNAERRGYVMVEKIPYRWQFPYFAMDERKRLMTQVEQWLVSRRRARATVHVLAKSDEMTLVALHQCRKEEYQCFR